MCFPQKAPRLYTNIGTGAFYGGSGLTSVSIGSGVASVGDSAFKNCNKLVEVINNSNLTITKGSSDHGYLAYYALDVHTGESKIIDKDGYLFYTYNSTNYLLGYGGEDGDLILPGDYNGKWYSIFPYAFYYRDDITSVIIDGWYTSIGSYAFYNCTGIKGVTIGTNVTSIGDHAFYNCTGLEEINFNSTSMEDLASSDYVFYNAGKDGNGIARSKRNKSTCVSLLLCGWYKNG